MKLILLSLLMGITGGQIVGNNSPCPEGFVRYQQSCYKYYGTNVKYIEAWTICKILNSEMLAIESEEENNYITQLTRKLPAYYWTGGSDLLTTGQFTWRARSYRKVTYSAWDIAEPRSLTNSITGSHPSGCIQVSSGKWRVVPCLSTRADVICELEIDGQVGP